MRDKGLRAREERRDSGLGSPDPERGVGRVATSCGILVFEVGHILNKLLNKRMLNAIQSLIRRVFYNIGHFGANEILSDSPFVMLGIDSGWPEKFVSFFFFPIC